MNPDEDLLGGTTDEASDLLTGEAPATTEEKVEKPVKKKAAAKKAAPAKKAPAAKKTAPAKKAPKAEKPVKAVKAPKAEKPVKAVKAPKAEKIAGRPPRGTDKTKVVTHNKPKLDSTTLAVIAVLSEAAGSPVPYGKLVKKVFGNKGTDDQLKPVLQSMKAKKLITVSADEEKAVSLNVETIGETLRSSNLAKLFRVLPTDPGKALTAGKLGGLVFGGKDPDDKWVNVRYGRAIGRILHRLMTFGAVGMVQYRDERGALLWYRLAQ